LNAIFFGRESKRVTIDTTFLMQAYNNGRALERFVGARASGGEPKKAE
jgi:hypothetical protein